MIQCVDIVFAEPENVAEVNRSNCFNSSDIGFNNVFSTSVSGGILSSTVSIATLVPVLLFSLWALS
jgi:hypothetical protein